MLIVIEPEGPEGQAQLAREHFATNGPPDAPPLPLSYDEREDLKVGGLSKVSFLEKLQVANAEALAHAADLWLAPLQRVRGKIEFDGLERVSTQTLLDMLEVPQRSRTAGTYRRLAKLMVGLGWSAVRVRDLTRGGYKEQVRGYVRDARRSICPQ